MGRGKSKGKSPKSPSQAKGTLKGQRRLDDLLKPRRSSRLSSSSQKESWEWKDVTDGGIKAVLEKTVNKKTGSHERKYDKKGVKSSIELEPALVLESDNDAQTIVLEKKKSRVDKKAATSTDAAKAEKSLVKAVKLKLSEAEQRELLKQFDLNHVYGPCRGISRRQRFKRARFFRLQPVPEDIIMDILDQHEDDFTYQKCIWDQNELLKLHV